MFNPVQRVSVAVFWSPNGSSPPFVILEPWNHHWISVIRRRPTMDDHLCIMHALGYAWPYEYIVLVYVILWVAGGNCSYTCRCNRIRGEAK